MANFANLSQSGMTIINMILQNQELCKLIYYKEDNPLEQPDIIDTANKLLMKQLFPLPKKAPAETEETIIVNARFNSGNLTSSNKGFADEYIVIDIMVHLNKWLLKDEKIRTYEILSRIDKLFNNVYVKGLSMNYILFDGISEIMYSDYFYGYRLRYKLTNNSNVKTCQ